MHDLVNTLQAKTQTIDVFVAHLYEYASDYFDELPLLLSLNFSEKLPNWEICHEAQRNIRLCFKECLNNAVKHANASKISISLSHNSTHLSLQITDDGKGFNQAEQMFSGNGLRNMHQRITTLGGSFTLNTEPGSGCQITLSLSKENLSTAS